MTVHQASNPVDVSQHPLVYRLIEICSELKLNRDDLVVFGSGPLLAHGLRQDIRDLDVVARRDAWRRVTQFGEPAVGPISGNPMVHFWGGRIQFSRQWISTNWNTDHLIERAEVLHGLRFATLGDVLAYKRELRRPKDVADIHALAPLLPECTTASIERPMPLNPLYGPQLEAFGQF
jgi:hypothetical protein